MGKLGKGKTLISVSVPNEWRLAIDRRANALGYTRSNFTRKIIETGLSL